ncbi:hypothetical protein CHIBA101_1740 [Actinomyces sp. Chiba101]|nr:hypothetical protein CHIBA101_1740 [Actinomyces sp. Chiba101]GAV93580.1 hypothetical protein ADENT20671_0326 [Actinomyces denticolens]
MNIRVDWTHEDDADAHRPGDPGPVGPAPRYHLACRAAPTRGPARYDRFITSCDGLSRPGLLGGRAKGPGAVLPEARR